jgi:Ca-activated chloride channel family protein
LLQRANRSGSVYTLLGDNQHLVPMSDFHFLRPWWLLATLPAILLLWRMARSEESGRTWRKYVAPHLLPHLLTGSEERHWLRPLTVLPILLLLAILALAGPTWQREPAPFAEDSAVLVVVLKVTPSMMSDDIQPNRLARATEKLHDLLSKRPGAKTALIAYAGSTHQVMPLTADAGIIDSFASELSPQVMPVEGSVAVEGLKQANRLIQKSGQAGWILWIADSASPEEMKSLADTRESEATTPVRVLAVASEGPELESLKQAASTLNAPVTLLTPDDADVDSLSHNTRFSTASEKGGGERWKDFGYWLTLPLTLLSLLWFRRGWMAHAAAT